MQEPDIKRIEMYLKKAFTNGAINVKARKQNDSAEVYIGDEFAGVLSRDDEDGELCWHFTMTVLEGDLDE